MTHGEGLTRIAAACGPRGGGELAVGPGGWPSLYGRPDRRPQARRVESATGDLVNLLDDLVEHGRTVIVIEHNLDVVARADWVIDLGPGAGHDGGQVVFEGTPAQLVEAEHSLTGQHLRQRVAAP